MTAGGSLLLVPALLGDSPPESVLPARTLALARTARHWVVETPKAARAYLKAIGHPGPIASLDIRELPERADASTLAALLAPARAGHAVALVSDAGAPGVADPGAALVATAHASGLRVVPLVGPSSVLLALMASGLSGQAFAFHGYLPVRDPERAARLRELEAESRASSRTQVFIETPFRNAAMLATLVATLSPRTRLAVAVDLTLPTESIAMRTIERWRGVDGAAYQRRPAVFLFEAERGRGA
ncbi:MAG TPA: SAM-dependent methyltransferase [Casimicrobiaceae bacterium]|jgi:16S rRNA (cytidine1402-2'-O)-methyltransferase|nr:SAM-dependent methyltransferase [Casimicrobiaceae bacterium]